ncbi:myelin and lymphocyte protein isoform X2 [Gracilinanus agilis]|uniref:myelin and lymphocyte protein isoform X2 n=1 Tax=Gracilinanus agilis TaxID=191870 RepID=UPI001CFC78AD|nr:myelin and lymphocyte protein isoform X2 [Gracilinanus agilis]
MAPAATSGGGSLPSGFSVLASFPDLLFIFEFIFGGLVWILVASSKVPFPMVQGWVMFVSVFCFVATTILLFLYFAGAHGGDASWIPLVFAYAATLTYVIHAVFSLIRWKSS